MKKVLLLLLIVCPLLEAKVEVKTKTEVATLAGGCFWGVEELLRSTKGVLNTTVGYTGGSLPNPTYEIVKTGTTGHAETVQIGFDPKLISFEELLKLYFRLHHIPDEPPYTAQLRYSCQHP